jgi:hypothetical protein
MFSLKRIPRLSPNLQQFSCTFVKPKKGSIQRYPPAAFPLTNEFKPVRQKQRKLPHTYSYILLLILNKPDPENPVDGAALQNREPSAAR